MKKLSGEEISSMLQNIPGWQINENSIMRVFNTEGFPQTMGLVSAICGLCQQFDHHPDYLTMKYSSVEVSFSTHSAGGLTNKDFQIAFEINKLKY
ncbi:MAG: putative pterin-4-alpha-carbinolamine dehydratase [Ignavibacteria bacterium]|nr:putative pterin-4-alpha-carbinolamine dehydratase [Ignavibacteria bacterium]